MSESKRDDPIQLPVRYEHRQLVDAQGVAWIDADALAIDYEDDELCEAMVKQIVDALNDTAKLKLAVEALEQIRDSDVSIAIEYVAHNALKQIGEQL